MNYDKVKLVRKQRTRLGSWLGHRRCRRYLPYSTTHFEACVFFAQTCFRGSSLTITDAPSGGTLTLNPCTAVTVVITLCCHKSRTS